MRWLRSRSRPRCSCWPRKCCFPHSTTPDPPPSLFALDAAFRPRDAAPPPRPEVATRLADQVTPERWHAEIAAWAAGQHTVGGAGSAESASGIVDSVRTSGAASSSAAVAAAP